MKEKITKKQIKELKNLLWILDSKHNVSVIKTVENINYASNEIVKLFSINVVTDKSEQLKIAWKVLERVGFTRGVEFTNEDIIQMLGV